MLRTVMGNICQVVVTKHRWSQGKGHQEAKERKQSRTRKKTKKGQSGRDMEGKKKEIKIVSVRQGNTKAERRRTKRRQGQRKETMTRVTRRANYGPGVVTGMVDVPGCLSKITSKHPDFSSADRV